ARRRSCFSRPGARLNPLRHCNRCRTSLPRLHATIGSNICPEPRSGCSVWRQSWSRGTFSCCCRDHHSRCSRHACMNLPASNSPSPLSNSFPPIERELRRINRCADVLLFTQPGSIRSWHPELVEFLARSSPNLVVASRYALSGLSEFGVSEREFAARHDKQLLLVHSDGPPLPSRPLHFDNGPSVSWLIPLLLFARPRRIFLFGADGGSNPSFSKRPYFY